MHYLFISQVMVAMTVIYLLLAWLTLSLKQSHLLPRIRKAIVTKWYVKGNT